MSRVINCLTDRHDPALLGLATLVCLLTWAAVLCLLPRVLAAAPGSAERRINLGVAGLAAGLGIWATHFVAALGHNPGLPYAYDPVLTAASAGVGVLGAGAGLLGWSLAATTAQRALAGAMVGLGLAGMHYVGIAALRLPAVAVFDPRLVTISLAWCMAGGAVGLALAPRWRALPILALAVLGMHLLGMLAVEYWPDGTLAVPAATFDSGAQAGFIGLIAAIALLTAIGFILHDSRQALRAQQAEAHHLRGLAELSLEAILLCTPRGEISDANHRFTSLVQQPREALLGRPVAAFLPLLGAGLPDWERCRALPVETDLATPAGKVPVTMQARSLKTAAGPRQVVALWDLREQHAVQARLKHQAQTCPLTGLPNRGSFDRLIHDALANAAPGDQPLALMLLDVDRMSSVNLSFGTSVGDSLLRAVADRLRAVVGESAMVARHGGGEFTILQQGQPQPAAATALGTQLVAALAEPFDLAGRRMTITCSVGIALAAPPGGEAAAPSSGDTPTPPGGVTSAPTSGDTSAPTSGDTSAPASGVTSAPTSGVTSAPTSGVTSAPTSGDSANSPRHDVDSLLTEAAVAQARVKQAGRDGYAFYHPTADRPLRDRQARAHLLEQELRQALDREELWLAWQPQARLPAGEIVGFEVLLRWTHPERGPISPAEFIPLAEASGTMPRLGAWVLRTACAEAAKWANPLRVAVNVSPVQVQQEGFAALVARVLAETGLRPERLELEVTEGVLIQDTDRALATLRAVKALGVTVAMDDFGTGYSSISSLRAFQFDRLKIDRSFVMDLPGSAQAAQIVSAVLGLAAGLGLPVVAEGVETEDQLAILAAQGCTEVQGWLLGRPLPIASFGALVGVVQAGATRAGAAKAGTAKAGAVKAA